MLAISGLSIHFGGKYLFDDIGFLVNPRDRIGLTGKNGAGKSTLLKILAGIQEPEVGQISKPKEFSIGYLPQDGITCAGKTLYDETVTAFEHLMKMQQRIEEISEELNTRTDYESDEYMKLIEEMSEATERFSLSGGDSMKGDVERVLKGLGFSEEDFTRLTDEFSGGWQMRIELAKILLRKPDCILLDEPTNHLDIESVQWLEEFLVNQTGAVIIVSHDRAFLDTVTNRTVEISLGKIHDYNVPYSKYLIQRQERRDQQIAAYRNQQKQIADTEKFIERFLYKATKANQVQSRVKMLDKMDKIEIEDEDNSKIHFQFPPAPRSGRVVVEVEQLQKAYDEKVILKSVDFVLERGEKVAFVGKNGEGKSTLSKIIGGLENYQHGTSKLGHNVNVGYYAQHQAEMLNGDSTVFSIIDSVAMGDLRTKIRSLLGAFLFSGDTVNKKVKVLSGGEKSRLSLCKLLLRPYNLLILDEPTNHLDMRSKEVLKQALNDFEGAAIIVSHDRDFLQGLTSKVLEFNGGKIKEYDGDIYEFLRIKKMETLSQLESSSAKKVEAKKQAKQNNQTQDRAEQKKREKVLRKHEKALQICEKNIEKFEEKIQTIEEQLADPDVYSDASKVTTLNREYNSVKEQLAKEMQQWEEVSSTIEQM